MIQQCLKKNAERIEAALASSLPKKGGLQSRVVEAMEYALLGGGKRIRATLVMEFARSCGGEDECAVPFACAVEMVHAYSLIHDDLPCMDDDDMRRGKPSCHKQFDEAVPLLAGDTHLTMALEVAASNPHVTQRSIQLAVKTQAKEAGALGIAGG